MAARRVLYQPCSRRVKLPAETKTSFHFSHYAVIYFRAVRLFVKGKDLWAKMKNRTAWTWRR